MKYKIEKLLESLSRWLYRNPFKALLTVFLFVAMLVSQAPFLKIDTTSEALLHKDDPSLMEYNRFRDQFGRSELIIIAVESPEVFEPDFLKQLKTFHADLENEVPYLHKITSLVNIRRIHTKEDKLVVEDLLGHWPENPVNLLELKQQVLSNPYYLNHIISKDGHVTAVVIETDATVEASLDEEQILSEFQDNNPENQKSSMQGAIFQQKKIMKWLKQ